MQVGEASSEQDTKQNKAAEPATGSLERFMSTFGPRMAVG